MKKNDNFQAYGEIESMHEFEFVGEKYLCQE